MGDFITAPAIGTRLAMDQIGGVYWPISKLAFGAEDTAVQVSPADPLPTGDAAVLAAIEALLPGTGTLPAGAATDAKLELIRLLLAGVLNVSATALPLPTGAATGAKQDAGNTALAQIVTLLTSEGGYLDGVEGLLGTGNGSLAAIVTALAATLKVQTPTPAGVVAGQLAVAANAAAAALPAAALVNGIVIKASASNTATVFVGGSNLATGVGGYPLAPGEAMSFAVANASALYFISTAASVVYFGGN
jgi:hypothetical protein